MPHPILLGAGLAVSAYALRATVLAAEAFANAPAAIRYPPGGFLREMTKREAAMVLNVRVSATPDVIKSQHKKIMIANHPDAGGSDFIAAKVNEAKDILLGKKKVGKGM